MSNTEKQAFPIRGVAGMNGYSKQTVTRMFEKEPGVIVLKRAETMHKWKIQASALRAPL